MKQLFSKIRATINRYDMIMKKDTLLVCVSGGADSIFLLEALLYLQKEYDIELFVANLDHGIRKIESQKESEFVKKVCKKYGVKLFHKKVSIKATKKLSIEEVARKKRYDFFLSVAKKNKIKKIATAHNMDDQAETVLMRVIKGTSLRGLTGIPPVREQDNMLFIRPIIDISKKDILASLKKNKIKYCIDSSNKKHIYFRNVVRLKIIPYLKKYNPKINKALCNLADSLREDKDYILNKRIESSKAFKDSKKITILLKDIVIQPITLQKEIMRDALSKVGANIKKLSFVHWKQIRELIVKMPSGKKLDLPGKVIMQKTKKELIFTRKS